MKKVVNLILIFIFAVTIPTFSRGGELTINDPTIIKAPADLLVLVNKSRSLPTNYRPTNLVIPKVPFFFAEDSPKKYLRQEAAEALEKLFQQAAQDGIEIYAASGYRSYQRQQSLHNFFVQKLGEESASQLSARAGQSEHQTGLAMDLTSRRVGFKLVPKFGETMEGIWLSQNAPQHGFILRYPKGKEQITGYQYEPWHLRYVGVQVALEITQRQITLEEYLRKKNQNENEALIPRQQML